MQSNVHYTTFPIDSDNQTNRNVPSVKIKEINLLHWTTQTAHLSIMFAGCQIQHNAQEEEQQYVNNEINDILYFEDRTVLNAADAFSSYIHALKWDLYSVYCISYSYKLIPVSDLP